MAGLRAFPMDLSPVVICCRDLRQKENWAVTLTCVVFESLLCWVPPV